MAIDKGGHNEWPSQITERPPAPGASRTVGAAFESIWAAGDRVLIDSDRSIVGTVTAFCFRLTRAPTIEVSYFHNGDSKTAWFEQFRLTRAGA
jgi:hypothetical protein